MVKEKRHKLAVVLTETIGNNVTPDWTVKETAREKIRVIVTRLLKKQGYPPAISLLAIGTVLQQAELLAGELIK